MCGLLAMDSYEMVGELTADTFPRSQGGSCSLVAASPEIISLPCSRCQLAPSVTQPQPQKQRKFFLCYFSPRHSSFPSSGRISQCGRHQLAPCVETTLSHSHRFSWPHSPSIGVPATNDLPQALPY